MEEISVYVPENFSAENILPESLTKYADDARYFTHKIYEQRIFDIRSKNDFVPLKAEYLRKIISFRKYKLIKESLLKLGVIETDNKYIKGEKSYGYRLGGRYREVKHKKITIKNKRLITNILEEEEKQKSLITLDTHKHLFKHLKNVDIDLESAKASIKDNFISNEMALEMIKEKKFFFHSDNYGRVHTNLTNLKSSLRKYLFVSNKELKEIDISCSQPFFFGLILVNKLCNNKYIEFNSYINILDIHSLRCDISEDAKQYLKLIQTGEFYDYLAEKLNVSLEDRKSFKVKFFSEVFFCKNSWKSKYSELFKLHFPSVYAVIKEIKEKDYTRLAKLLQKVESNFIINKIVRKMMDLRPDDFIGTIHDSLLVHSENVEFVKDLMISEFAQYGLIPDVKVK